MSSPIALPDEKKSLWRSFVIRLHQKVSHTNRVRIIADHLSLYIKRETKGLSKFICLDVGCGDRRISSLIAQAVPSSRWSYIDLYTLPEHLAGDDLWKNYSQFDGENIPFEDNSFDIVLFSDVLHHTGGKEIPLIREAARVGRVIIIKDSFEYSLYSRFMLQLMDFVGNWGYGVSIPKRYMTIKVFQECLDSIGIIISSLDIGCEIYNHIPVLRKILRPEWHFFAVLYKYEMPNEN